MSASQSILDVILFCEKCGCSCMVGDAIPCCSPDGRDGTALGCPQPDCGGMLRERGE